MNNKIHISKNVEDINSLSMPDWTPFISKNYYARRPFTNELGVSLQKSVGCSMTCNYCPYASIYGNTIHYNSDYVINTIRHYYEKGVKYFMFRDQILVNKKNSIFSWTN